MMFRRFVQRLPLAFAAGMWLGLIDGYSTLRFDLDLAGPWSDRAGSLLVSAVVWGVTLVLATWCATVLGTLVSRRSRFSEQDWTFGLAAGAVVTGVIAVVVAPSIASGGSSRLLVVAGLFAVVALVAAGLIARVVNRFRLEPLARGPKAAALAGGLCLALALVAASVGWPGPGRASAAELPNVLLISVDTLRADHLGAYGYARDTSPNIDALAGDAVTFERAYSQSQWTLPSHSSMFTGLDPLAHRVMLPNDVLGTSHVTLAERLEALGYRTAGFVGMNAYSFVGARRNLDQGFEAYHHYPHPSRWRSGTLTRLLDHVFLKLARRHVGNARAEVDRAARWVWSHQGDPFFLFLHFFDVHSKVYRLPYEAPRPFHDRFCSGAFGDYDGCGENGACASELLNDMVAGEVRRPASDAEIERLVCRYDGGIAFVDHELGRLFSELKRLGLYERTIVVLTSDHGEAFFEHGAPLHTTLHDEVLHVPMIIKAPTLPAGHRVSARARTIDIVPTVLDLLDVEVEGPMQGRSLVPALASGDSPDIPDIPDIPDMAVGTDKSNSLSLRTDRWKLIVNRPFPKPRAVDPPAEELYDLLDDPGEQRDRAAAHGSTLVPELTELLLEHEQGSISLADLILGDQGVDALELPEDELERLRSLGYIQ